jgi:hypothetical protein
MKVWDYWQIDDLRKDQYFYIGFALLASAVNDYAVARDLHLSNKLNWAASAYYYSMVHTGRLVLFQVYGDFPTGHGQLASAFGDGFRGGGFWFSYFAGNMEPSPDRSNADDFRRSEIVSRYTQFGLDGSDLGAMFQRWASILDRAKRLREDSNYESLLIAHEHNHILVTEAFQELCRIIQSCTESVLNDAVHLFRTAIHNSPRAEHWLAFLNHDVSPPDVDIALHDREGLFYIEDSLRNIVEHDQALDDALSRLQTLRSEGLANPILADEGHKNIVVGAFGEKRNKMESFWRDIHRLEVSCLGQ